MLNPEPCGSVLPCPALALVVHRHVTGPVVLKGPQDTRGNWPGCPGSLLEQPHSPSPSSQLAAPSPLRWWEKQQFHTSQHPSPVCRTAQGCRGGTGAGGAPGAKPWPQGGGEPLPGLLSRSAGAALDCAYTRLAALQAAYLHRQQPAEKVGSQCHEGEGFWGAGSASCMARPAKRSSMSTPLLQGWAKPKQACLAPAPEPGCATVSVQPGSEFSAVISSSKWRGRMRNISLLRADLQAHAEGADCIHGSQGRAASSRCDLESTWERGGTSCTGHVNTLQHVLRLSCTGGPLRPPVETQGLPVRPAGSEGGTRRSHACLWKASHGEMGTWKSSGASEELTSVLLGKEGEQAIPDLVERACFTFCPCPIVVPSLPHWGPWKPPALCL